MSTTVKSRLHQPHFPNPAWEMSVERKSDYLALQPELVRLGRDLKQCVTTTAGRIPKGVPVRVVVGGVEGSARLHRNKGGDFCLSTFSPGTLPSPLATHKPPAKSTPVTIRPEIVFFVKPTDESTAPD